MGKVIFIGVMVLNFSGNFIDDKKTGKGTYVWQDGKSYMGYWKDNNACGTGIYRDPIIGGNEKTIINQFLFKNFF